MHGFARTLYGRVGSESRCRIVFAVFWLRGKVKPPAEQTRKDQRRAFVEDFWNRVLLGSEVRANCYKTSSLVGNLGDDLSCSLQSLCSLFSVCRGSRGDDTGLRKQGCITGLQHGILC